MDSKKMKYILPTATGIILCSNLLINSVAAATASTITPYLGFDVANRYMPFQERFGKKLFSKNSQAGTIFAGIMFNEYLGVEIGFTQSKKKTAVARLDAGDYIPGTLIQLEPADDENSEDNPASFSEYNVSNKIQSWNANISLHLPLSKNMHTKLFVAAGFTALKVTASLHEFKDQNGAENVTDYFKDSAIVPSIKVGISHKITNNIGIRFFAEAIESSNLSMHKNNLPYDTVKIRPDNAVSYGIGLFIKL
ncbi:MAG: hypothetical protein COB50_03565 [Thiotrichales bacterium]|nr:MAG: hypothetical protein COB50_03565 [Thiotrichales bacterium]